MNVIIQNNTYTFSHTIGKGVYGIIYKAIHNKNHIAVKKITFKNQKYGIPFNELVIMQMLDHPFLQKALCVDIHIDTIFIVQPLAVQDAYTYISSNVSMVDNEKIKLFYWINSLVQSIAYLHENAIVHGDIKAENILVFDDNSIKLTDFSLSFQQPNSNVRYNNAAYTLTHRAPEVILAQLDLNYQWGIEADLWALGCTIFQLAYKNNAFTYQGEDLVKTLNHIHVTHALPFYYYPYLSDTMDLEPSTPWPDDWSGNAQINCFINKLVVVDYKKRTKAVDLLPLFENKYTIYPFKKKKTISRPMSFSVEIEEKIKELSSIVSIKDISTIKVICLKWFGLKKNPFVKSYYNDSTNNDRELKLLKAISFKII